MDQAIIIYVLLALIIVLPIIGVFLKRKALAAGAQRWESKKDRQAASGGLGATLTLNADRATAEAIVAPIFEAGKRVRRQEDGTWAQTHYNDDDVVYELVDADGGTIVAVQRAIEFAGTLNGIKAWRRFRDAIVAEAAQRGVEVTQGERSLARAEGVEVAGAQVWLPA